MVWWRSGLWYCLLLELWNDERFGKERGRKRNGLESERRNGKIDRISRELVR